MRNREETVNQQLRSRFSDSWSDNLKSKTCPEPCRRIRNPKWLAIAIVFMFVFVGVIGQAQQQKKIPRIGFLSTAALSSLSPRLDAFHQGLLKLGYVEGKNISIEYRSAEGKINRLPELAAELVRLKVDCIVTAGENPTIAAK